MVCVSPVQSFFQGLVHEKMILPIHSLEGLQICEVVFNLGRDIQDFDKLFQKNYYVILGDI